MIKKILITTALLFTLSTTANSMELNNALVIKNGYYKDVNSKQWDPILSSILIFKIDSVVVGIKYHYIISGSLTVQIDNQEFKRLQSDLDKELEGKKKN